MAALQIREGQNCPPKIKKNKVTLSNLFMVALRTGEEQQKEREKKFHVIKIWILSVKDWKLLLKLGCLSCRPKKKYIAI
jgi:hypothetical protein